MQGLQIPAFEIPAGNCIEVTVKEIVSPRDFWIQKANDDLDLLMEKMWLVLWVIYLTVNSLQLVRPSARYESSLLNPFSLVTISQSVRSLGREVDSKRLHL